MRRPLHSLGTVTSRCCHAAVTPARSLLGPIRMPEKERRVPRPLGPVWPAFRPPQVSPAAIRRRVPLAAGGLPAPQPVDREPLARRRRFAVRLREVPDRFHAWRQLALRPRHARRFAAPPRRPALPGRTRHLFWKSYACSPKRTERWRQAEARRHVWGCPAGFACALDFRPAWPGYTIDACRA